MTPDDLLAHAERMLSGPIFPIPEADCRRAVSAAYYALFHLLTGAGADMVSGGPGPLSHQVRRAFNHGPMRQVCNVFSAAQGKLPLPPYGALMGAAPSSALVAVTLAFQQLHGARQIADYDLSLRTMQSDAELDVRVARQAFADWQAVQSTPEARVFLTALLLADRWTRRG